MECRVREMCVGTGYAQSCQADAHLVRLHCELIEPDLPSGGRGECTRFKALCDKYITQTLIKPMSFRAIPPVSLRCLLTTYENRTGGSWDLALTWLEDTEVCCSV